MSKVPVLVCCISLAMGMPFPKAQNIYKPQQLGFSQAKKEQFVQQPSYRAHELTNYIEEPRPYAFDYGVQDEYSGANFKHAQSSDGKAVTGSYTVALPDGRIQRVTYTADHNNGFIAEVTYEGEAQYPEFVPQASQQSFHQQPSFQQQPKATLQRPHVRSGYLVRRL